MIFPDIIVAVVSCKLSIGCLESKWVICKLITIAKISEIVHDSVWFVWTAHFAVSLTVRGYFARQKTKIVA